VQNRAMASMRDVIESCKEEFIVIDKEVDLIYEIAGIQKALDGSRALLFNSIKNYPGVRCVGNVFSRADRTARIFGVEDPRKLKFKCLHAIKEPLLPRTVNDAPCQEVVETENIDLMKSIPVLKHTPSDGARVLSSAVFLLSGESFHNGMEVSFKRTHFRGKDWASVWVSPGSHLENVLTTELRGRDVPVTANISVPPSVALMAAAHVLHTVVPSGANEVAIAGGLDGSPVDVVKAKTVDAYALANAEWVLEGYLNSGVKVWETEEAERMGKVEKRGMAPPFMPEWMGYLGRAGQVFKFRVTGVTHRQQPIYHSILGRSFELDNIASPFREACFYELAEQMAPGFVKDVHVLEGIAASQGNVVFQVRKRRPRDEGLQREIISACFALSPVLQLVVAVDDDVDIYSPHDLLWAIITRWDAEKGVIRPAIRSSVYSGAYPSSSGIGIDATVPWIDKDLFERAHYPSDQIDLRNWLTQEQTDKALARQSEYARLLAITGH
jgi:gallate decarboxylase subunit C